MPALSPSGDIRLLSKVSKLYYERHLTQQQIAERLHLSRSKVSRLLQQAELQGIVQISVVMPSGGYSQLENELEARFGLKEAIVVDVEDGVSPEMRMTTLGAAGAGYLQRMVEDGDVLGITWGTTLNAMVNALHPYKTRRVRVVQTIGGLGAPEAEIHATDISSRLAHLLGAKLTLIPAPGIVADQRTKSALLSDSHVQSAFSLFPSITIAFVGIGVPEPTSVVMRDGSIMTQAQLDGVLALGAVGDIGLRFFDAEGCAIRSALDELVIGMTLEQLGQIERVVGVAGGQNKARAVHAALRGRLINVLITDRVLASRLLELSEGR
ncbi:sugar-binding transcriptional regulator [Aggregatilinea lenta]|uniref:sugar-binding transcriptional regulator n=1 Tax=Aggregatilinea lenta TaxID=913108 RepID=UPI000E5A4FDD|nr:sugar-binding transcriptional regulator [Aggregatilinea lenta]